MAGTSYGVPWYVETRLLYYRTDLAEKAGYDEAPTDWDGLNDMAKAMQDKAGAKWGIGLQAGGTGSWQSRHAVRVGRRRRARQGRRTYNFDTPEMLKAAAVLPVLLHRRHLQPVRPWQPTTEPDFANGEVPMFISGPWMMSAVEDGRRRRLQGQVRRRARSRPAARSPPRSSAAPTSSSSRTPRTATPRGSSWSGSPSPRPRPSGTACPPTCPRCRPRGTTRPSPVTTSSQVFGKQLETAQAPPSFPTWEQVIATFDTEMEKVTKTGADPAEALKSVQQQADVHRHGSVT